MYVYKILQMETQLIKVPVPVDASSNEPEGFIFMTDDALTNNDKLLVLVHGSGCVRAGQWARRYSLHQPTWVLECIDYDAI